MQRMMQAVTQDPTFMEMARQMQDSLLSGGMGGLSLGGGGLGGGAPAEGGGDSEAAPAPGALALDPAHYMQVRVQIDPGRLEVRKTVLCAERRGGVAPSTA